MQEKKVCLVIGAGAGIGVNVAKKFAISGYHAVISRRTNQEGLDNSVKVIEKEGGNATGFLINAIEENSIENLIEKVDKIIIGGGMIANFLTRNLDKKLKEIYQTNKEKFYIPEDLLVTKNFSENSEKNIIHVSDYNDSLKIVDIGFKSIKSISELLKNIEIAIWNGSMGVFEWEQCSMGTKSLINLLKENNIKTYAGGGSTIEAINKFDHKSSFEHVSSGGGAFLELLEKETLPGIENLYEARYKIHYPKLEDELYC